VMAASRSKVSFWRDGSNSPWNYGWLFVCCSLFSKDWRCWKVIYFVSKGPYL
jgi:hypothetical protein